LFAGVNDTAEKVFTGFNNTADKFFASVNDTADKTNINLPTPKYEKYANIQYLDVKCTQQSS
jgi:hypothetical protein